MLGFLDTKRIRGKGWMGGKDERGPHHLVLALVSCEINVLTVQHPSAVLYPRQLASSH
jgi:hypothetical protein